MGRLYIHFGKICIALCNIELSDEYDNIIWRWTDSRIFSGSDLIIITGNILVDKLLGR